MAPEGRTRKLAAILSADVKGYSRLMGNDEAATVSTITAYREVFVDLVSRSRGRVVDSPGDNILAEFASVVDAVQSAREVQAELERRNSQLPEHRRMQFRIGINLGDVIEEEGRLYGDGINIAARIEGLADGGGICLSAGAYEQVRDKIDVEGRFLGLYDVKNIERPIQVYALLTDEATVGRNRSRAVLRRTTKRWLLTGAVATLALIGTIIVWERFLRPGSSSGVDPADIPSIAVLPFDNLNGDTTQEYFSDGVAEDIITDLSKISGLLVIARNSSFQYKDQGVDLRQVTAELGCRFVLEGSVRRSGDQLRINAQLIDGETGTHVWAERFDEDASELFSVQERITKKIVSALAVKLTASEEELLDRTDTQDQTAHEAFQRGWWHYQRRTPDDFVLARDSFEQAVEIDPQFSKAYAALALTYWRGAGFGWTWKLGTAYHMARLRARWLLEQAGSAPTALAHRVRADMAIARRRYQEAIREAESGVLIDPNGPEALTMLVWALAAGGRGEQAIFYAQRALRIDPKNTAEAKLRLSFAHLSTRDTQHVIQVAEEVITRHPDLTAIGLPLAVAYAHEGRLDEAREALEVYSKGWVLVPDLRKVMYFVCYESPDLTDWIADGLLKAGLPGDKGGYYKFIPQNRLSGEEIQSLIAGRKLIGMTGTKAWAINCAEEGDTAAYSGLLGDDEGRIWVQGDELCEQWNQVLDGLPMCRDVYRNPEGNPDRLDEYLSITDFKIIPFSVVARDAGESKP